MKIASPPPGDIFACAHPVDLARQKGVCKYYIDGALIYEASCELSNT